MPVRIRLRRDGAKKRPFYHVVAADSRRARNGRYIEELGYYNPIVAADAEPTLVLKEDRVRYWLSVGALPSDTAAALFKKVGILERTVATVKPVSESAPTNETVETPATEASATPETAEATESTTTEAESPAAEEA
jgi:small subunit ribosomal protein S16